MPYQIRNLGSHGIILWMEAACGIKQPLMRWENLEEMKTFGESLLDYYYQSKKVIRHLHQNSTEQESAIAERLINQAFADDGECPGK